MAISCVDGVCNIYDALYNVKPGSFKTRYNLIGNAWDLYKSSKGTTKAYDGDVQVGDMITFSRSRLKSDDKKGYPSENQHVGVVVRIENGKPIIKHYANGYKEEPIDNVTLNNAIKYKPSKITKFGVPTNIASKVNIPIRDNMTESEKQAINALNNTDFRSLMLNQEQLDDLAYSAISMTGVESKYGNSRRALFRAIAPGFANKLQQVKRWYNNTDESKDFTDFTTEKSQGYGSIKFNQTFRNIGYYDTDSLSNKERIQINNRRLKENDVENLYSIRNKVAKTVGLLGYDEKEFENVDVATIAAMAKLSDLYYNENIPNSRQILKRYKGNTKAINEFDLYKNNYKANIDNDFNGWKQLLFEYVNNDKRIRHKTKQNIIKYLETHTDIPLQFKAYLADQLGIKDPLTENSLSTEEKDALREIALKAINETNGIIGYDGKGVTPWIQKESDRLASVGQSRATAKRISNALTDPYTSLQQTFGQALAYIDGNDIVLEDAYDFNNQGSILNFKHLLYKSKGDPYGMFRGSGSMTGSSPENPRKVLIRIPKDKYIVDVGMPVVETIQVDDKTYHNAKGRLKPRNRFIQQYNIIEDNAMKKFGGKLRYGWGGFTTPTDIFNKNHVGGDYIKKINSGYGRHSAKYYVNQGYNPDYIHGSYGAMVYKPYSEMTKSEKSSYVTGWDEFWGNDFGSMELYTLTQKGINAYKEALAQDQSIYANMQNKLDQDVDRNQKLMTNIARFGGMVGIRRKYPYGGAYVSQSPYSGYMGWGTKVKPENISHSEYNADDEGIQGTEMTNKAMMLGSTGASLGAMSGLAAGTTLGAWGGPIGMAAGLIGGLIWGAISGNKKKKEEEARRRKLLAEQKEQNRQNTISNMQNRYENDVAKIRTAQQPTTFAGQSFYSEYGGLIPMRKYNYGGVIPTEGGIMIPTSDDTMVAKGATHEQGGIMLDPQAEVENNEVIRATPTGDQIFSDSLYVPGTRVTYAKYANKLSRQKGKIENDIKSIKSTLNKALDEYPKLKQTHAQDGTSRRNMEKLAAKLNIKTGQLAQLEQELSNTFMNQEEQAYALGLRDSEPVMAKYGGNIRKHKFGVADMNLITNGLSFIGNILGNELTYKSNKAQLDFMKKLKVPKQARLETQYYKIDTTPYEQARRKMTAETRRFNKWIENEVSNPQILRNQKRKALIGYYEGLGDIAAQESAYRTSVYDKNYNARVTTDNMNRQIAYQDALAEYNRDMDYYNALIGLGNQAQSGRMAAINQMMQATGSYLNQRMYLASLPEGVQKEFYWGKNNG